MASVTDKYHVLVELSPDSIFLIDLSTAAVAEANDEAATLLGYGRSTLKELAVENLHPTGQAHTYRSLFERTIAETEMRATRLPDESRIHLVTQSGERVPVELHARVVDVDGTT